MKFVARAVLSILMLSLACAIVLASKGCGEDRKPIPGELFGTIRPSRLVQIELPAEWGKQHVHVQTLLLSRHRDGRVGYVPVEIEHPRKGDFDRVYLETREQHRDVSAYSPFAVSTDPDLETHLLVLRCDPAIPEWRVFEFSVESVRNRPEHILYIALPPFDALAPLSSHPNRETIEAIKY